VTEIGAEMLRYVLFLPRLEENKKGKMKIAVEIKTFLGDSLITEFYTALGQYLSYRTRPTTIGL